MADTVEQHYSGSGSIVEAIATALRAAGREPETVSTGDLAAVDEFHIRGREATLEIAEALGVGAADVVVDIGCGLGGAARRLAERRLSAAERRVVSWPGATARGAPRRHRPPTPARGARCGDS